MMTQNEILTKGYKALVDALGVVGMLRFIQHFDPGRGDYTKERHQWLEKQSVEDVLAEMKKWKNTTNMSSFVDNEPL